MNALLLYPHFPKTFWSFDRFLEMAGVKAFIPPLGILTVASLLPPDWNLRFHDRNVAEEPEADWHWCDLVIVSAMMVQREDFHHLIRKAVGMGKKVAVGGPYPTSLPEHALQSGADYLILDEGEITVPAFLAALERGEPDGVFRAAEKPDVSLSPVPRYDLLQREAYLMMAVQFSRGCPFNCEFCDIINLYGRKPRTKENHQLLAELQTLCDLGWRGSIFMVDDNFIGNQHNVKRLLRSLIPWMREHRYPFNFFTEASVNLAEQPELLELMAQAGFFGVFLGIETPDQDSLAVTRKQQNTRHPLVEACRTINAAGLVIYAGFILGFDGERSGAGERIEAFVAETAIPQPMLGILQALPNTALWTRLEQEGRLLTNADGWCGDQNTLMNFVPTRPSEEIGREYVQALWRMYEPATYLERCLRHCLAITPNPHCSQQINYPLAKAIRLMVRLVWSQGVRRADIRNQFWRQLLDMGRQKPRLLALYLSLCAAGEHFWEYRLLARERIGAQLGHDPLLPPPTVAAVSLREAALVGAE
ncbi:B12-binding domain-containing radical SAM protein [Synechococcus sp. FACHB-909]|uniref:B12-binding domain-containing radical SAM protein n=1 Tax=Synechococcus sp. FACHB-909 TaxID=2692863 RepID=UPI00168280E8|nr:B12-binding domain-containing radical SAM protein [Synechococcus sp. FACHB-909]MBD2718670.1 B12-binding domain-containing radical SAM protein [Synechococcus sp. FACHB-909]